MAYAVFYFHTKLSIVGFVPTVLYFAYSALIAITFWCVCVYVCMCVCVCVRVCVCMLCVMNQCSDLQVPHRYDWLLRRIRFHVSHL